MLHCFLRPFCRVQRGACRVPGAAILRIARHRLQVEAERLGWLGRGRVAVQLREVVQRVGLALSRRSPELNRPPEHRRRSLAPAVVSLAALQKRRERAAGGVESVRIRPASQRADSFVRREGRGVIPELLECGAGVVPGLIVVWIDLDGAEELRSRRRSPEGRGHGVCVALLGGSEKSAAEVVVRARGVGLGRDGGSEESLLRAPVEAAGVRADSTAGHDRREAPEPAQQTHRVSAALKCFQSGDTRMDAH